MLGLNPHALFAMERVNLDQPDQERIRVMHADFRGAVDRMWNAE